MRHARWIPISLLAMSSVGCSIGGTWRTVKVEPEPPGGYPLSMITFDENSMTYAATIHRENEAINSEGRYDWDGFKLTIKPREKAERTYSGYLFWGKLKLNQTVGGKDYEATLVRDEVTNE